MIIELNMMQTATLCLVMLFIGEFIKKRVIAFQKFCIPAPVIGGFLFAIIHLILRSAGILEFAMDDILREPFMMVFFTSIGMTSGLDILKKGGLGVLSFFGLAVGLVIIQNLVGIGLAKFMEQPVGMGMLCGSVTQVGGHGTAAVWGKEFAKAGLIGAEEIGMAAATFGLIAGSLIGGPIGGAIIKKYKLTSPVLNSTKKERSRIELNPEEGEINVEEILKMLCVIFISISLGVVLQKFIRSLFPKIILPAYVTSMLIAGVYRNTLGNKEGYFKQNTNCSNLLGNVGLNVFLAMALSTLRLWELEKVAGPMMIILLVQTVVMALYARFVTFKVMGKDYEAAVLSAGICGFGMGATANGIANMSSVTEKYGPAQKAFFILPIVGAFLIDLTNTGLIILFASIFK